MKSYLRMLAELDPAESVAPSTDRVAVLLTGRSVLTDCHLEPVQTSFMNAIGESGIVPLHAHFPYHARLLTPVPEIPTIWEASYRNTLQHLACLVLPELGRLVARHVQVVLERSPDVTFITGSCGIGLLEAARPHVRAPRDHRWRVIALGPVCWTRPRLPDVTVVRGEDDWISARFGPLPTDYVTPCGHMDYYDCPDVVRVVRELCARHAQ